MQQNQTSKAMKDCIKTCLDCHQICTETATLVLHAGAGHSEAQHLVALLDCAQICAMCAECAEICMACAKLCEAHQDPDGADEALCRELPALYRELPGNGQIDQIGPSTARARIQWQIVRHDPIPQ